MAQTIIGTKPHIYRFTKAIAEQIIQNESHKLPLVIIRPSIGQLLTS